MKKNVSPIYIVFAAVACAAVLAFAYLKGGVADKSSDVDSTVKELTKDQKGPSLPAGGAVPGVSAPVKMR
jgi:hypothetical protein